MMMDDTRGEPFFAASLQSQQTGPAIGSITKSPQKEKQKLLGTAAIHFAERKGALSRSPNSDDASDIRPAAVLSAARRPKAAARLQLLRRRRWGRPAVAKSISAFKRGLRRKVTMAMTAHQPRRRIPNRLRRAFTKNRIARRTRSEARWSRGSDSTRQAMSEEEKYNDNNAGKPDDGSFEDFESEFPARPGL